LNIPLKTQPSPLSIMTERKHAASIIAYTVYFLYSAASPAGGEISGDHIPCAPKMNG
jgi:hypothetical protein